MHRYLAESVAPDRGAPQALNELSRQAPQLRLADPEGAHLKVADVAPDVFDNDISPRLHKLKPLFLRRGSPYVVVNRTSRDEIRIVRPEISASK